MASEMASDGNGVVVGSVKPFAEENIDEKSLLDDLNKSLHECIHQTGLSLQFFHINALCALLDKIHRSNIVHNLPDEDKSKLSDGLCGFIVAVLKSKCNW